MNIYLIKEQQIRKHFFVFEKKRLSLKIFSLIRKFKLINLNNSFLFNKIKGQVHFKNRCFITGRGKGIYKQFGISRIKFRELALNAFLVGVKKI